MVGALTERKHERKIRFEGDKERCVVSLVLEVLTLRCQLRGSAGRSRCGSGAQLSIQAGERRFWNHQLRSVN